MSWPNLSDSKVQRAEDGGLFVAVIGVYCLDTMQEGGKTCRAPGIPCMFNGWLLGGSIALYCRRSAAGRGHASSAKGLPCILVDTVCEKLRVATLHGRLPTSPGSLAHNRLSHTRPVRYETFPLYFRILRKTSNAAQAALRHSHPFLTLAKRIGLEPKHIP